MKAIKKIVITIIIILILFIIIILISAWNMGAFASIKIKVEERGPYYIITYKQKDPYNMMSNKIEQIQEYLNEKNVQCLLKAGILTENPLTSSLDQINALGGCIIRDSIFIDTSFVIRTIEKRSVLIASIYANPAIAPFKTYPALSNQIRKNNINQNLEKRIIELYHNNGLVEVEIPIKDQ